MTYVQKIYLYIMSWLQDLYLCIVLLLLMSTDNLCGAQFPAVCTNPSNFHEQICCPEPFASAGPCGSHLKPPRGECIKINTSQTTIDVRGNWPHYYSQICKCRPRFGNFDCGECAFGFKGTSCNEKVIRTRRFLNLMSESETNDLIKTLYMAKTFPSRYVVILKETRPGIVPPMRAASIHDVFVWNHYYISKESYGKMVISIYSSH